MFGLRGHTSEDIVSRFNRLPTGPRGLALLSQALLQRCKYRGTQMPMVLKWWSLVEPQSHLIADARRQACLYQGRAATHIFHAVS